MTERSRGLSVLLVMSMVGAAQAPFLQNVRVGTQKGDNWEPGILADRQNHLYVVYTDEKSGKLMAQRSDDFGANWNSPVQIAPLMNKGGQADQWLQLDADGRTVWVSFMNGAADAKRGNQIQVVKSTDLGVTWSSPVSVSGPPKAGQDKDVLAVRGNTMLVCWDDDFNMFAGTSFDHGQTFTIHTVYRLAFSTQQLLCSGAAIDQQGNLYVASDFHTTTSSPSTMVRIDKSSDGGNTWTTMLQQPGPVPFPCPTCDDGPDNGTFFAPQITIDVDADGTVYAIWNAASSMTDRAPNRIFFACSSDQGATWSTPADVSTAAAGVMHSFATVLAGPTAKDVRIAWEDNRMGGKWNVFYRASNTGGIAWGPERRVSDAAQGFQFQSPQGFSFPYGDQIRLALDSQGVIHATFGESLSYSDKGHSFVANENLVWINRCDLDHDGRVTEKDVQLATNLVLSNAPDPWGQPVTLLDVQKIKNAALGSACSR